jgi:hypothetical protein
MPGWRRPEARPESGRPAKDYIGRLVAAMLERRRPCVPLQLGHLLSVTPAKILWHVKQRNERIVFLPRLLLLLPQFL